MNVLNWLENTITISVPAYAKPNVKVAIAVVQATVVAVAIPVVAVTFNIFTMKLREYKPCFWAQ